MVGAGGPLALEPLMTLRPTASFTKAASFKKVCVIGAGVMGQGIAAHLANARVPVLLLDLKDFAAKGLQSALQAKPALFFTKADASLVATGNIDDDLVKAADCDWI